MFDLDIKAKGFDKPIQNLANYDQVATQENRKAMGKAVAIVTKAGKENVAVGVSGEARAKIHGEIREDGPGAVLGVVGGYSDHSLVLEKGADAHWPNLAGLALWVKRKLQVANDRVQSVTYLVARKISKRGLRAQPYLEPAFEDNQDKITKIFEQALANIVRRLTS